MRSTAFPLLLVLVLAASAAGIAFIGGRTVADAPGSYERGVRDGIESGREQARADFAPGTAAYRAVLARGRREGRVEGRAEGRSEGARRGSARGRAAAFGRFPGGWDIGRWYMINVAPTGERGEPGVGARVLVRRGRWYRLCGGRTGVCERTG